MEKTIFMYTTFLNWRKDNDVDNVIEVSNFQYIFGLLSNDSNREYLFIPNHLLTAL